MLFLMGEKKSSTTIDALMDKLRTENDVIKQTTEKMTEMNGTKEDVVAIMKEVSHLSSDVTAATEEMASAVAEQAHATGELANYTNQLNTQSENLQRSVDQFKL